MKRMLWVLAAIAALLLVGALVALRPGSGSEWTELSSVDELRETFNGDSGSARIVLLLSPT